MMRSSLHASAVLLLVLSALSGCSNEMAPVSRSEGPSTLKVTASTPRSTAQGFEIDFSWSAASTDAPLTYEWAVDASRGSKDHRTAESLRWTRTRDTELTLSFDEESSGPWQGVDPRSRTFYVRVAGASPSSDLATAELSFTPLSLAPEAHFILSPPTGAESCVETGRHVIIRWEASDPDSKGLVPTAVRYVLLPLGDAGMGCPTKAEYEAENPIGALATDDPRWSDWIPYDKHGDFYGAPGGADLGDFELDTPYLVGLQAIDEDGATSRQFAWNRSAQSFRATDSLFPSLRIVEEATRAYEDFSAVGQVTSIDVVGGHPLSFSWSADASAYNGVILGYRYGWDLADPDDATDPGWAIPWGDTALSHHSQTRTYPSGTHTLTVQALDISGAMMRAQVAVVFHAIPSARQLVLLVDDWRNAPTPEGEILDAVYDARWQSLFDLALPRYDLTTNSIDTDDAPEELSLEKALQYEAVIWFASPISQCYLSDFAEPRLTPEGWNWLASYQRFGGNLLMVGPSLMGHLIPRSTTPYLYPIPLDVPEEPPLGLGTFVDSQGQVQNLGTTLWPYQDFGLEAIDIVRPAVPFIYGERAGLKLRTRECDEFHTARVDESFLATAPGAEGLLWDLTPTQVRIDNDPTAYMNLEEFYNTDVTTRGLTFVDRPGYTVMFRGLTRVTAGLVDHPEYECGYQSGGESTLDGVPIGIMSGIDSQTKPDPGSHDFLWGFNVLEFEEEPVARLLYWIFVHDWDIVQPFPEQWEGTSER